MHLMSCSNIDSRLSKSLTNSTKFLKLISHLMKMYSNHKFNDKSNNNIKSHLMRNNKHKGRFQTEKTMKMKKKMSLKTIIQTQYSKKKKRKKNLKENKRNFERKK